MHHREFPRKSWKFAEKFVWGSSRPNVSAFALAALHYHSLFGSLCDDGYIKKLHAVFPQPFDEELFSELRYRKLLNLDFDQKKGLDLTYFLSRTALPARTADLLSGVPAAILLAECMELSGWNAEPDVANDFFLVGHSFPSACASFLDRGIRLATDATFEPIWISRNEPSLYLRRLRSCRLWSSQERFDICSSIEDCHFQLFDSSGDR